MPEIVEGTSTPEATETTEAAAPVAAEAPRSVEDVEAIWQKRIAGKDRAHAAEVAELRRQLEVKSNTPAPPSVNETPEQRRIRELEEEIAEERKTRIVETRKARFPKATEYLGDAVTAADEAKLAGLEALLAGEESAPAPVIAPNSPPRGAPKGAKPMEEMTKQELQDTLRQIGPAYQEYLNSIR